VVVVSGEALMDVFATGSTPTGMALDARIGGSPLNVALGLARLAQPVAFLGGVSSGFLGERLMQALQQEGVNTVCTTRMAAPTTLSLVGLDAQGVANYAFYGDGAADRLLPLAALQVPATAAVLAAATAFHFSSYAMVVDPVGSTQRALVDQVWAHRVVSYDPNVRLNVEPNIDVWRSTLQWMLPRTTLLKVSDEDLALLYPGCATAATAPAATAALAAQWLAAGVQLVVVTRGAHGAWAWTAHHHLAVSPVPVQVVDTVGAGDTFSAALLAGLAERGSLSRTGVAALTAPALQQLLVFAAQAAAITCSRKGADLPRRAELPS
jgi:fructokinase